MLFIRPAKIEDADNLLKWKNDPVMRKYSIVSNKAITKRSHIKWLEKNLDNIFILNDGTGDIGDVRLDEKYIAIKLAPEARGKGYGATAINHFKYPGVLAKIVDGNVASMKTFINCGFNVIAHDIENDIGYYTLKYEGDFVWIPGF
jgi:RimJ/RimL family protein N-acetyltransferase